jgi:serine/threonine protein kinase
MDQRMMYVMEYWSGGELLDYLKQVGSLDESEVYSIASQMWEAVRSWHNSKVIHRDLKMENILFADESRLRIKIVDFGIAGVGSVGA